jgi:DNA primase
MTVVEEVKDRLDIADIVGESVTLKKAGKNLTGFCPFHANTRTPAFVVFPDTGTWRCFGACNEGGDIFRFVMKKEGWDFPQALSYLAERAGVELRPATPRQQQEEEAFGRLRELLEQSATFYRHALQHTSEGQQALGYLQGRGLKGEALEAFGIGYAPKSWDALLQHLQAKGFSEAELLEAGMVSEREGGGHYDRFRHRIMFPIRDARGRMAGFGARVMDPADQPKFLNSPQTPLFDKSALLYGLDQARKAIRAAEQAVLVEGYLDVVALHQAGYRNVVSPMGTALSERQLRSLKRFSRNIVLALDADAAGSQATLRGLNVARQALDREMDPVFDARGLVRHEGRLDSDIRVLALPAGKDPDEVVTEDPAAWPGMLETAKPIVQYVTDVLLAGRELDDPKVKAEVARQVLPLIEDVVDPVEREAYRQELARKLRVDERAVMAPSRGYRLRRSRPAARPEAEQASHRPARAPLDDFCLGLLLADPELSYRIDRQLLTLGLEALSSQDFAGTTAQLIFQAVRSALSQVEIEPGRRWRELLPEAVIEQAEALAAQVGELDFGLPRVVEAITADFLRLRMRRVEEMLQELGFQQQSVQENELLDQAREDMRELAGQVQQFISQKQRLDQALADRSSLLQGSPAGAGW